MIKGLFNENCEYSPELTRHMLDVDEKMSSKEYAEEVKRGGQLTDILNWAKDESEFYSFLKGKNDLKLTDFPVMTKELLKENYDKISVKKFDESTLHKMYTSGSTGTPFTCIQNPEKRTRHLADIKYFGALAGYEDHTSMCYFRTYIQTTPENQEKNNIYEMDCVDLSGEKLKACLDLMAEKNSVALMGFASTIETAVDYWLKNCENNTKIKTVITTSEACTDILRDKLYAFFGENVTVRARYSNEENGIMGQEIDEKGTYRLNWASYYFEVLKMDSDKPAEYGEVGRIVLTDLYNKAFPMIRYDNNDIAVMGEKDGELFPVFTEIYGRRMDNLYDTRGNIVSPFLVYRTVKMSNMVGEWQFVQETEKDFCFKIKKNDTENEFSEKENVIKRFKEIFGEDADIRIEWVSDIPKLKSQKRKLVVSKLNK